MSEFDRIARDAAVMGHKACFRGTRVTVGVWVGQIGAGHSVDETLRCSPIK